MTLPQRWGWTESLSDSPPAPATTTAPQWVAAGVFRPEEELTDGEYGLEETAEEFLVETEPGTDEELGAVELAEWELSEAPASRQEAFPSGVILPSGTGDTSRDGEHWDPNGVDLPLYATGPSVRGLKLAPNFTVGELVSSGGIAADVARISPHLVRCLQAVRDRLGKPVRVSSGYRSWARNVALYRSRSAKPTMSRHCSGQAADISVKGLSGLDLAKVVLDACGPDVAVGIDGSYVHVDVRGTWKRWSYASGATAARDLAALDAHRAALSNGRRSPDTPLPSSSAPPTGSLRARIATIAEEERTRWGDGKRTETDPALTPTLQDYYRTGVGLTISAADLQSSAWQNDHPWSAVFISWVMQRAGAGTGFEYSPAHRVYVAAAKRNALGRDATKPFWAYPITQAVPEVGDLVCAGRRPAPNATCSGATFDNVDDGRQRSMHCDIVVAVDRAGRKLTAVGGNVSQSVKSKTVAIDARGHVLPGTGCQYFAVVKVLDNATSAAQLESAGEATVYGGFEAETAVDATRSLILAQGQSWGTDEQAVMAALKTLTPGQMSELVTDAAVIDTLCDELSGQELAAAAAELARGRVVSMPRSELTKIIASPPRHTMGTLAAAFTREILLGHHEAFDRTGTGTIHGNRCPQPQPSGTTASDCTVYVTDVLARAFAAMGRADDWPAILREATQDSGPRGLKGTVLIQTLQRTQGWEAVFWAPDPRNPADRSNEHPHAYHTMVKATGTYYGIKVDGDKSVINYNRTDPALADDMSGLERLRRLQFGVLAARGGTHMALVVNGVVHEVHWAWPATSRDAVEATPLERWGFANGLLSGAIAAPPGDLRLAWRTP
jgi:Uncharacterized protein conserved in bacteria (DUF2272)/Peptidase M15